MFVRIYLIIKNAIHVAEEYLSEHVFSLLRLHM